MLKRITKIQIAFFVAIIVGSIGAYGQSYLIYHELVHTYPYKIMGADFYKSVANFGIWFVPIIAIICGVLLGLKRFWLATIAPVVLCPLLFSVVLKMFSIVGDGVESATWHFDGKTPAMAAQEFFLFTLTLSFVGLIIGGICSFILLRLSSKKNLP
jgi:hypothetical protein